MRNILRPPWKTAHSRVFPELPREIWTLITQFLPKREFRRLRSLNSAFYQAALDAHYREVTLFANCYSGVGFTESLQHLKRLG
jgi:hypothetical protein